MVLTIILAVIIFGITGLIIFTMIRNRLHGKGGCAYCEHCGGSCGHGHCSKKC